MAEEAAKQAPAQAAAEPVKKIRKKKLRPTNCAQSNKRIRRKDWYYRNGKYFANKKSFKLFAAQEAEKAAKAKEAAEEKAQKVAAEPEAKTG